MGTYSFSMLVAALAGMGLGAACHGAWSAHVAMNRRRIPGQWQLRARPLFTDVERTVWHWLERVFFDHHVLVKIPVIRFLSPRSITQNQHSHELLKGVYCTFTICASDGSVVGCVDIPGSIGIKASNRDLKKKLFEECGMAYAILSASQLPALEALRAAFLGDMALARQPGNGFVSTSQMPFSQPADMVPVPALILTSTPSQGAGAGSGTAQSGNEASRPDLPQGIDMTAVDAARSSLQSKLDQNRRARLARIDELGASLGIVGDKAGQKFAVPWDDSFIMGEDARNPEKREL